MDIQKWLSTYDLDSLQVACSFDPSLPCDLRVSKKGREAHIAYRRKVCLFRALGILKENCDLAEFEREETSCFAHIGYLIDVARDAVPQLETLKRQAFNLATLGFDQIEWYLEDVFEVKGEPYFGYLRGRYTQEEMKEFDRYCSELGIELIPAIQTLAHLNALFQWPAYGEMQDVGDILLAKEEKTYALIEKMLDTVKECFSSKTVHIGMDEAHLVGRGRYLDRNGYQPPFEVLSEHLNKVVALVEERGLHAQMWSDMFFRMAFSGAYYDKEKTLPPTIASSAPKNVDQVYWDYVTSDKKMLKNMFRNHRLLSEKTIFAGGGWKWNGWNPSNRFSIANAKVQLPEAKKAGVDTIILTAWSDDGAEASLFSILPTMIYYAEFSYGGGTSLRHMDEVSKSLFSFRFRDFLDADMTLVEEGEEVLGYTRLNYSVLPKILLYNDPLSGAYDGAIFNRFSLASLPTWKKKMRLAKKKNPAYALFFDTLEKLCACLEIKATLGLRLREAYQKGDRSTLENIAEKDIPLLRKRLNALFKASYEQWMAENKTNGYEVISMRLGGLYGRLGVVQDLLRAYLKGERKAIEELETPLEPMKEEEALGYLLWTTYHKICSVAVH